jgi:hypothetical protein
MAKEAIYIQYRSDRGWWKRNSPTQVYACLDQDFDFHPDGTLTEEGKKQR